MRKIYIVLTYTGTILSKIVKVYTRKEYSHVSIALDQNLNKMYSFGRINPYNPFIGGFVHESINSGTFKRFKKTKTKIYSMEIDDEKYDQLENIINQMFKKKKVYKFNFIGLLAVALKLKIRRERCFYCAEFVKYVLEKSEVITLPELIKPEDFEKLNGLDIVYKGILNEYKVNN